MVYSKIKFILINFIFLLSSEIYGMTYAIYLDAGSSGTRLYLYQYGNDYISNINDIFSEKVSPGLSSFVNHPENAGKSLQLLLDHSKDILEKYNINLKDVKVNLLATAGMRSLNTKDQNEIYNSVKSFIENKYAYSLGKVRTISGKEEGLYGWLAINQLMQTFKKKLPTVGNLEMGGGSSQISYEIQTPQEADYNLQVNGNKYYLISRSFDGLGLLEARKSLAKRKSLSSCYPLNYQITITQTGEFNLEKCDHIYKEFIEDSNVNKLNPYPKDICFIAHGGFYNVPNFFGEYKNLSEDSISPKILSKCSKSWEILEKTYSHKENPAYLAHYCADAIYIKNLLFRGYFLKPQQIFLVKKYNNKKISWPLGALLYDLEVEKNKENREPRLNNNYTV